jgi:hypothetical protein
MSARINECANSGVEKSDNQDRARRSDLEKDPLYARGVLLTPDDDQVTGQLFVSGREIAHGGYDAYYPRGR